MDSMIFDAHKILLWRPVVKLHGRSRDQREQRVDSIFFYSRVDAMNVGLANACNNHFGYTIFGSKKEKAYSRRILSCIISKTEESSSTESNVSSHISRRKLARIG